jgi:hypothetical protein
MKKIIILASALLVLASCKKEADICGDSTFDFKLYGSPTKLIAYVNGNLVSFTATGGYPTGTATIPDGSFPNAIFYIGSRGGSNSFFNGRVSSLKIYGFKINASQVQQNFNTYRSRFGI